MPENPYPFPTVPVTWYGGMAFEDAGGVWWDVQFDIGDQIFFVHRDSGERILVAIRSG